MSSWIALLGADTVLLQRGCVITRAARSDVVWLCVVQAAVAEWKNASTGATYAAQVGCVVVLLARRTLSSACFVLSALCHLHDAL